MHIELPERTPHTFRDMAVQYAMIVLGILTAIGFEQVVEAAHHHALATHAAAEIEAELQRNLAEISDAVTGNRQRIADTKRILDALMADVQAGNTGPETVRERMKSLTGIGITLPGFRRNAWDTATANQALTYLPVDDLRRYSESYTAQTVVSQTLLQNLGLGEWSTRLGDASIDNRLGRADAVSVLKALNGYSVILQSVNGNLIELQRQFRESLAKKEPGHAASMPA